MNVQVNIPGNVASDVVDAFGGTIGEHVQAAVDRWIEQVVPSAKAQKRKDKMGKYDRLDSQQQSQVDEILATAPDPDPEPEE